MKAAIALVLFTIFFAISLIHLYWGLGGKWGAEKVVPTKENGEKLFAPKPVECIAVAVGLSFFGLFALGMDHFYISIFLYGFIIMGCGLLPQYLPYVQSAILNTLVFQKE